MLSVIWLEVFLFITNNLPTVTWFEVFQSNTNKFLTDLLPIDGTLTCTTTPGQSELECNGNKGVTTCSLVFQGGSLTIGCSLVPYPEHPFWGDGRSNSCAEETIDIF